MAGAPSCSGLWVGLLVEHSRRVAVTRTAAGGVPGTECVGRPGGPSISAPGLPRDGTGNRGVPARRYGGHGQPRCGLGWPPRLAVPGTRHPRAAWSGGRRLARFADVGGGAGAAAPTPARLANYLSTTLEQVIRIR
jgi:hypothetical protein